MVPHRGAMAGDGGNGVEVEVGMWWRLFDGCACIGWFSMTYRTVCLLWPLDSFLAIVAALGMLHLAFKILGDALLGRGWDRAI